MPFDPTLVSELASALDDQFVWLAETLPHLIVDLFGADVAWLRRVPRRPLQSRRRHDVAVICGVDGPDGELMVLLHVELQTRPHPQMGLRMLVYQAELVREHGVPVDSMVVYLNALRAGAEREGVGTLERLGQSPLRWSWRVRCLPDEPVSRFEDPARPALALLSSAAVGGCRPAALHRALTTILHHWGDSPHLLRLLSFHFSLAELRESGQAWINAARSLGIDMNDIAEEEDGFTRMVRKYYERTVAEGRKAGLEAGREAGLEAGREAGLEAGRKEALRVARETMSPEVYEKFAAAMVASSSE